MLCGFADPALEARSPDQRIRIRPGPLNARQVKAQLTAIRTLLAKG